VESDAPPGDAEHGLLHADRASIVIEAASEGVYDWNIQTNELWVSDRLNELFGFADGELRSQSWFDKVDAGSRDAYSEAMREHLRGATPRLECEYQIRDASGELRWVSDRGLAIRDESGRATRLVGAIDDITQRRRVEEELRVSEERYALSAGAANEGIYDLDLESGEIYYSPRLLSMMELDDVEMTTPEHWLARIHPDDRAEYEEAIREHVRGGTGQMECEYRYLSGGGEWRWARQRGLVARHEDGRAYRLAGSTGDITETVQLQQELDKTRQQLQDAMESMSEGLVLFDADDRILLCNSKYREYFLAGAGDDVADLVRPGTSFESIIREGFRRGMFPDAGDDEDAWVEFRLSRRRSMDQQRLELLQNTGMWLQINERRTTEGGVVSIYTDVTELKQRELELAQARDEAEAATAAKSEFLANMSHELRTPLNAIIGLTEMLIEDAEDDGVDDHLEPLGRVKRAGTHLLHLINEILDLSKIEAGRMEMVDEQVELGPLLADVVHTAETLATQNSNHLVIDVDDDLGQIRGDTVRVRQIALNLVSNACKFTEAGTVTIRAGRERGADGEELHFAVEDSGIGISDEQIDRLFRDFSQADSSMSRRFGGTGLGLAISRRLARMMGGDIEVESTIGVGSTFTMVLPYRAAAPAAADLARTADTGDLVGEGATVLVIDDDATSRDLVRRVLAAEGFDVISAGGATEGLERARAIHPDLITLDVVMPDTDGWDLLRELKADPHLSTVPVVMLTVVDEPAKGFALGASDYLSKPLRRDELRAVLARHATADRPARILVVEDDVPTREVLRRSIGEMGWSVAEAGNGREGLERFAEQRPDLILLDLMMPEMDGFEFLSELRFRPGGETIPVVVMTAAELTDADRAVLRGGAATVLAKPAHAIEELPVELRSLLQRVGREQRDA
jgi:PAS domain S-box-containing protein